MILFTSQRGEFGICLSSVNAARFYKKLIPRVNVLQILEAPWHQRGFRYRPAGDDNLSLHRPPPSEVPQPHIQYKTPPDGLPKRRSQV